MGILPVGAAFYCNRKICSNAAVLRVQICICIPPQSNACGNGYDMRLSCTGCKKTKIGEGHHEYLAKME